MCYKSLNLFVYLTTETSIMCFLHFTINVDIFIYRNIKSQNLIFDFNTQQMVRKKYIHNIYN